MELSKFERQLKMLELLIGNCTLSPKEIGEKLDMSVRSVYRYIEFFEGVGFHVFNDHGIYSIDYNSPFVANITQKMHFRADELQLLADMLGREDGSDPVVNRLKQKFRSAYGIETEQEDGKYNKRNAENLENIRKAINNRHACIFQKYESLNSKTTKDRFVEPYQVLKASNEVRCYEVESGQCKTFKISRIKGSVIYSDKKWEHREKHTNYFTDIFGFSSDKVSRVIIRLTNVARRILIEEYGVDESMFLVEDGVHYLASLSVCNNKGAGRFFMGMLNEVEIIKGKALQDYINQEIEKYNSKNKPK